MGRISNKDLYPVDIALSENDYWIGTDGDTQDKETKVFYLEDVVRYIGATVVYEAQGIEVVAATDNVGDYDTPLPLTALRKTGIAESDYLPLTGRNSISLTNSGPFNSKLIGVEAESSAILGGVDNSISGASSRFSLIAGGVFNTIESPATAAERSVISGGDNNRISGGSWNTIGGGGYNEIVITSFGNDHNTISGGLFNEIIGDSEGCNIAGGNGNQIDEDTGAGTTSTFSGIGAGVGNLIQGADSSFIGGGDNNYIDSDWSAILGGDASWAAGDYSVVLGGTDNVTRGDYSLASGISNAADSYAETVLGLYATQYTPASTTSFDASDRLFTIGNGINFSNQSDAFSVFKDGTIIAPSLDNTKIDTAGAKALITKEYLDANGGGGAGTLQEVTTLGNTSTNDIILDQAGLQINEGSLIINKSGTSSGYSMQYTSGLRLNFSNDANSLNTLSIDRSGSIWLISAPNSTNSSANDSSRRISFRNADTITNPTTIATDLYGSVVLEGFLYSNSGVIYLKEGDGTFRYTNAYTTLQTDTLGNVMFNVKDTTTRAILDITSQLSAQRTYTFPDRSGTLALENTVVEAVVGTAYTIASDDVGKVLTFASTGTIVVTVDTDSLTNIGDYVEIDYRGTGGTLEVQPGTGAVILTNNAYQQFADGQYSRLIIQKMTSSWYRLFGELLPL